MHRRGPNRRGGFSLEADRGPGHDPASRRRAAIIVIALLAVMFVGGAVTIVELRRAAATRSRQQLQRTVDAYLTEWSKQNFTAMHGMTYLPPATFVSTYQGMWTDLHLTAASFTAGAQAIDGVNGQAPFDAKLQVGGLGSWSYRGKLSLLRRGDGWVIRWTPAALYPSLAVGEKFGTTRTWPARAPILAQGGKPLTIQGDVVEVGIEPSRIADRQQVLNALATYTGADPMRVAGLLDAPGVKPNEFISVITLRLADYLAVKPNLFPVPGLVFRQKKARILVSTGFAQQVVGRVGPISAEELQKLGPPYRVGDIVGQYGLEAAFERQLAGTPSGSIVIANADGKAAQTLQRFTGTDGKPVKTTLDIAIQQAAEAALNGVTLPAAVVVMDVATGDLRAVVSSPVDGPERALSGHYPPGSTFKVITTAALLANGVARTDTQSCPTSYVAGGRAFGNFEGESFGLLTLDRAFERSCNTAFIQWALTLPPGALKGAAEQFGFNHAYSLPLPVAGGQFPPAKDDADRASAAIGQGRVLASPVQMASVAAAVASGTWHAPRLLSTDPPGPSSPLPPVVPVDLQEMMRLVVTSGTGTAAFVPGLDVAGKTGTAQFGDGTMTHAWFIGFSGHLAFAVLVEGGGVGGQVAAPIAGAFLRALPAAP
ncbi:MAG TPA: penicillin-binding protein [Actinobacteria bacterium]|nr:penicillin-binding protein [Actinomycetota bacterium]